MRIKLTPALLDRWAHHLTPFLLVDRQALVAKYEYLRACFPFADVIYAIKANPHPEVLRVLAEAGCGFEVSNLAELELVRRFVTQFDRIYSSNTIKAPDFVRVAHETRRVAAFAFDSIDEIEKLATLAPGSRVYVRLVVDNTGSEWPLTRKFGAALSDAVGLLARAADAGLEPIGTTFHVGSQNRDEESWLRALETSRRVWDEAARRGINLSLLNLGGGLPAQHLEPIPSFEAIGDAVGRRIAEWFPTGTRVIVEPGRALIGEAAVLVASVIGRAKRGDRTWIYLDAGVFNGLMETIDGFRYEVVTSVDGPRETVTLAGPTCDSVDVVFDEIELPSLCVGDRVYFLNAGAYTTAYASSFNGWPPPTVCFTDEASSEPP